MAALPVLVRVVDRLDRPVAGVTACLLPACGKLATRAEGEGFRIVLPAKANEGGTTRLRLQAPGFAPAEAEVPAEGLVPLEAPRGTLVLLHGESTAVPRATAEWLAPRAAGRLRGQVHVRPARAAEAGGVAFPDLDIPDDVLLRPADPDIDAPAFGDDSHLMHLHGVTSQRF